MVAVLRVAASKLPDGLHRALAGRAGREGAGVSKLDGAAAQPSLGLPPRPRGGGLGEPAGRLAELEGRVSTLEPAASEPRGGRGAGGRERRG